MKNMAVKRDSLRKSFIADPNGKAAAAPAAAAPAASASPAAAVAAAAADDKTAGDDLSAYL